MPKLQTYKTSAVDFDGAAPLFINAGEVTFNTVTQNAIKHLVPWGCSIAKVWLSNRTAATSTTLYMDFGTTADDDAFLNAYQVDASAGSTGMIEISLDTTVVTNWISQSVSAGDTFMISFQTGVGGAVSVLVLLSPNI